jgi:sulfate/thiosulfate transport system permease protein
VAFTPIGIAVALTFVGLPFVVRTVEPVLQDLEVEVQEAAQTLGASAWEIVRRIVLPTILPALLAGFTMAFARALGEYGSVVFISGNLPMKTEITTLLIMTKLEQYDYTGAAALAVVMLMFSVTLLMALNVLQTWSRRRPA